MESITTIKESISAVANSVKLSLCDSFGIKERRACYVGEPLFSPISIDDEYFLMADEAIFILENGVNFDEFIMWQEYNARAVSLGLDVIGISAWHNGSPRTPESVLESLEETKRELERLVLEENLKNKKANPF